VVQTAAKLVIEPIFEADFDEAAYGYRPRRSAHDAIRIIHKALDDGRTEVVDADLRQYFDTIPHAALMTCLARRISDGRMLHVLKMWLKAPVAEADERGGQRMSGGKRATRGTPQGRVVSPLLANIYMHRYIKAFRRYGLDQKYGAQLVTYADDLVVLCRHGAHEVLERTRRWMASIGLALNEDKTGVRDARCASFRFPGLHLRTDVLAANRRTLQRSTAFEAGHRLRQGGDPERASERGPGAVGGRGPSPEPHRAGLGGVLLLRIAGEGAARCAASLVPCGAPLSPTTAQAGRALVSAVPRHGSIRGAGRSVS
jgi:group II intron reverse transcriptase/maturase